MSSFPVHRVERSILFGLLLIALCVFAASAFTGANGGNKFTAGQGFSPDDFDWRDTVPYLYEASVLPGGPGLETILENCGMLRAYIAKQVRSDCKPGNVHCDSGRVGLTVQEEVSRRIDGIVREGIRFRHKSAVVDYSLDDAAFPFSQIAAALNDKGDAYLILRFADQNYTTRQLQAKYGEPYDTSISQWYSEFKYRIDDHRYSGKAVFEVNPVDGAVLKLAISVKTKKQKR